MRLTEFDFPLDPDLIAQRPASPRDAARLLVLRPDRMEDRGIADLPDLLRAGDLLVFNNTAVIPARLSGLVGAARVSVTLHQRIDGACWRVFAKPGRKLKPGATIVFAADLTATALETGRDGDILLRFDRSGGDLFAGLEAHGTMPLPPYIRSGIADDRDRSDYQTLFAAEPGAVAAPTAALHFTPALMAALAARGVGHAIVTLHVGAGTFLPVRVDDIADHRMHPETGRIDAATAERINRARAAGGRIVAVGTTAARLLESAAAADGRLQAFSDETRLFITPGYRFRGVDRLITNFHLPKSTLLMLIAAFAGLERIRAAYAHAQAARYRFYSYGDACLIEPGEIG